MYKKIIFISCFVCLCIHFQSVAQSVKTNLYVMLKPCDYLNVFGCQSPHIADITQEFVLEKFTTDTLLLTIDKYGPFQIMMLQFFYRKLTVDIISQNKKQSIEPNFDGITLRIPLPTSSCTVKLNYLYSSDYETRNSNPFSTSVSGFYLWPCLHSWHSWYFSYPDMQFDKVEFQNTDSLLYFFVDVPSSKQNEKIILDTKTIDVDISFFLFQKPFFHKTTYIQNTNTINLYLDKGATLTPNPKGSISNNTVLPGNRATQALEDSCKHILIHALEKINTIFPPLQETVIDIIDADLSINNAFAWGRAAHDRKNNHYMILIDTSFWHNHNLTHELIHLSNYVSFEKNDTIAYFFGESITEYLAVCFRYEDKQARDLVFNKKIIRFAKEPNEDYSIFKLESNSWDENTVRGSSLVVYDKTPFIIHTLAQMVGEDKFHAALKQFYAKVAEGMAVNLPNFEQTLKENGITDSQWNWFMKNL